VVAPLTAAGVSASEWPAPSPEDAAPADRWAAPARIAVVAAGTIALLYGLLLRLWLLAHLPLFGDEAVVGLMARGIDHGHFSAFYWGQRYGGLESYVAALVLPVGGGGESALNATPAVLCAIAAGLVAAITYAWRRNRLLALAAGSLVWVWPYAVVWESVREVGFRYAALCCGLTAVLCSLRACEGRAGRVTFVVLGLAAGLGWWASPEIVYFALPALVLLGGWWWRTARGGPFGAGAAGRARSLGLVAAGLALGSLPWWYANVNSGFASLRHAALPANNGVTYSGRLAVFFRDMLPLQLGVKTVLSGAWVGGPVLGPALYALLVVLVVAALGRAVWLCARRRQLPPLALAAGVAVFPFLYAAAPGTGYWIDGRYGIYLPALVVALFGTVLAPPGSDVSAGRARPGRASVGPGVLASAAAAVLGATCLTVGAAHASGVPASPSFFSGWQNPDASMQQVVDAMRADRITDAYGDYWTAYSLDFVGHGQPVVSPSVLDVNRSAAIAAQVRSSPDPAWLFFAPDRTAAAAAVFSNPQPGPGPYTEATFEALLRQQGIGYRVVKLGVLDAVVPARRVTTP
jgi:hypothetical protein